MIRTTSGVEGAETAKNRNRNSPGPETSDEDNGDSEQPGGYPGARDSQDDDFEAEDYKEHCIQDVIHQFLEEIEIPSGSFRHGQGAPMIADEETGGNDTERPRDVEAGG